MGILLRMISGLADGLAFALGAMCLAAAVLAHGGRFSIRLDILTHFAPIWLLGSALALAFGLTLATPSLRPLIAATGGLGLLAAGALILPELVRPMGPRAPADAPHQIKLIQLNGWGRNRDVEGTARWIAAQAADVVVVEEIEPALQEAILRHHPYQVTRGMLHVSIFSRGEPQHRAFQLDAPWDRWPGLARARLDAPGGGAYDVVGMHLTWPTERLQTTQRRSVADLVDRYDKRRLIVVGDFNLTPWSSALHRLGERFGLERRDRAIFSWPAQSFARGRLRSPVPFLPIDHVYAGSDWRTVSIERGPRLGSDHFPIVVRLALQPGSAGDAPTSGNP